MLFVLFCPGCNAAVLTDRPGRCGVTGNELVEAAPVLVAGEHRGFGPADGTYGPHAMPRPGYFGFLFPGVLHPRPATPRLAAKGGV